MPSTPMVLTNGRVVTLDDRSTVAAALVIDGDRITFVGDADGARAFAPRDARTIDLHGRSVLPGFYDAHAHMDREGLRERAGLRIAGLRSIAAIVAAIRRAVEGKPAGEWIVCQPLGDPPGDYITTPERLAEGRFPNRHDLDAVAPHHPVYIRSVWGWWATPPFPSIANSAALARFGIDRHSADPPGIEIVRDAHGEPTGVFLERNRTPVIEFSLARALPRFDHADRIASIELGSAAYAKLGTTSIYEGHGLTPALLRAYREVAAAGKLKTRTRASLSLASPEARGRDLQAMLYDAAAFLSGAGTATGRFAADGVTLDPGDRRTAAVAAREYPYEQWAGFFFQGYSEDELAALGTVALGLGLRLNTFVVDAPPLFSVERSLRILEAIHARTPITGKRLVAMHVGRASDAELRRLAALDPIVTMIPAFLYQHAAAFALDELEDEAMPIRRVLDAGLPIALASDNVPPSMLFTAWEALARVDRVRGRGVGASRLDRLDVLRLCCRSGHALSNEAHERGVLAPGRRAELIVLDGDPLGCRLDALPTLAVDLTMVDGEVVFDRHGECS